MVHRLQYLLPHHLLSRFVGRLAESRRPWIKNTFIKQFLKKYPINMQEAMHENPYDYDSFNDFFIRKLKPELRPISNDHADIVSPVDGYIAQMGRIQQNQLLQAKGFYFDLIHLLGNDSELADYYYNGHFATLYLAPHNYHRIHMPLSGHLIKTIYVPGRLFSVNRLTSECIPKLYARNERLICIFSTKAGLMAVILIGAMIVGSMQTVWMNNPIRTNEVQVETFDLSTIQINKGDELGLFKLGSTVILLFAQDQIHWEEELIAEKTVQYGQHMGSIINS